MTITLVDSNVLLDFLSEDDDWFDWSQSMLHDAAEIGRVAINPVIYAEVSIGYEDIEDFEAALPNDYFVRLPIPWEAAFLAAKCFNTHTGRGGPSSQTHSRKPDGWRSTRTRISGGGAAPTRSTRRPAV